MRKQLDKLCELCAKAERVQGRLERTPKRRRNVDLVTIAAAGNPRQRRPKATKSDRKRPKRRNPTELQKAVSAYKQFHGVNPHKVSKGNGRGVLISLGELREIVYQPTRGKRKGPAFFHNFAAGNVLAVTADGRRLVIVDRKNRKAVDFDLGIVS